MSVSKAQLTEINARLQAMVRALLRENKALGEENQKLCEALSASMNCVTVLNERYQKLADYLRQLHDWLKDKQR